jgi:DNA-binding winged helix-turn-helix (wHTH) protein
MQGDRETSNALTTVKCSYDHDKLLLRNPPLQTTLTSNEGHLLLALIEGVTDKEDLIRRVWGERGLIVSDSSYYKALHTLRHYLSEVGLDRSVLKRCPGAVSFCF